MAKTKTIDTSLPVRYGKRTARIICTNRDYSSAPIVALVKLPNGGEEVMSFNEVGTRSGFARSDDKLRNVNETVFFRVITKGGIGHTNHKTLKEVKDNHQAIGYLLVCLEDDEVTKVEVFMD